MCMEGGGEQWEVEVMGAGIGGNTQNTGVKNKQSWTLA